MSSPLLNALALVSSHGSARLVQTAVRRGLFDVLQPDGRAPAEVATALGLNPGATLLWLRALAALELVELDADGVAHNSELARDFYTREGARSVVGMVLFEHMSWDAWSRLELALETGATVRPADMYQNDPEETATFIMAMDSLVRARGDALELCEHAWVKRARKILDVGGGPGTYVRTFCQRWPHLEAEIFDLPATLEVAEGVIAGTAEQGRIRLTPGDYRTDALPRGADVVFLSNIVHGENEQSVRTLLKAVYDALEPGGVIVIKDHILDACGTKPAVGAVFSMFMLLTTGGRDYTIPELTNWLLDVGFEQPEVVELSPELVSRLAIARRGA
jgi:SAM-dependent methyltransferase